MHTRREIQLYGSCTAKLKRHNPRSSFSSYVFLILLPIGIFLLTGLFGCAEKEYLPRQRPPK